MNRCGFSQYNDLEEILNPIFGTPENRNQSLITAKSFDDYTERLEPC